MNLDRDLRDALQPLGASDPVADATRVLGALGKAPKRGPFGLPKAAWWTGIAALALGVLAGFGGAHWFARSGVYPMESWPQMSKDLSGVMEFTAFGAITIDEPGEGEQHLKPNTYRGNVGTTFTTKDGLAGIYMWANDARVRLASQTVATVEPQLIALTTGRVWVCNRARPAMVRVRTDLAIVEVDAATAMVERTPTGLWVWSLEGAVVVRTTAGEARKLTALQQLEVDERRGPGAVTDLAFAGSVTSWMTQMILLQQDPAELYDRISYLVVAWLGREHRDAARVELHRLGSPAVPRLYDALGKVADDPALLHESVALIADIAQYAQKDWLFALLERDDAEIRGIVFHALVRVTGEPIETEAFWRTAPANEREEALKKWRGR